MPPYPENLTINKYQNTASVKDWSFIISVLILLYIRAAAQGLALDFLTICEINYCISTREHSQPMFFFLTLLRLLYSMVSHTDSFVEIWQQWKIKIKTMIISKYIKDYLCKYLNLRCLRHGSASLRNRCIIKKHFQKTDKKNNFRLNYFCDYHWRYNLFKAKQSNETIKTTYKLHKMFNILWKLQYTSQHLQCIQSACIRW